MTLSKKSRQKSPKVAKKSRQKHDPRVKVAKVAKIPRVPGFLTNLMTKFANKLFLENWRLWRLSHAAPNHEKYLATFGDFFGSRPIFGDFFGSS